MCWKGILNMPKCFPLLVEKGKGSRLPVLLLFSFTSFVDSIAHYWIGGSSGLRERGFSNNHLDLHLFICLEGN